MARLQWNEDRVRAVYEDAVSTALSLRYAKDYGEFQRIDGAGGDGGRDVQFRTASLLDIFQLKSFSGRLGTAQGRRAQVERSLERAAALQPDSWTLAVPIDPTPEELRWFDGLRGKVVFPIAWFGRTELDALMAEFPVVPRYFVEGKHYEVVQLLKEIAQERASIGTITDAIERLHALAERLDEMSPHYRLDFERHGDATTVIVMPRYPGAENDRPITVSGQFDFPETEVGQQVAQQVAEFFAYGGEVEVPSDYATGLLVDAPGGLAPKVGEGGKLVLKSHPVEHGLPISGRIGIVHEDQSLGPSLPVRFTNRVVGERGVTLAGSDLTGAISIRLRVDMLDHRANMNLSFSAPSDVLPASLLQLYRFIAEMSPPGRLSVTLAGHTLGDPMEVPTEFATAGPQDGLIALLEDLELIQSVTATPFPVPEEIPAADVTVIRRVAGLLRGESVDVPSSSFTTTLLVTESTRSSKELLSGESVQWASVARQSTATILGQEIPIGTTTTFAIGRLMNLVEVRERIAVAVDGDPLDLEVRVDAGSTVQMLLGDHITPAQPSPETSESPAPNDVT